MLETLFLGRKVAVARWTCIWMASLVLSAQAPPAVMKVPLLSKPPAITRSADLSDWAGALRITEFGCWYPEDTGRPVVDTVAHVAWGPDGLYVAIESHDPTPATVKAFPGRRDNLAGGQDTVTLDLDATGTGQSAVSFTCNALGVQADALQTPTSWSDAYDLLWDSVGVRTSYGFLVKMRIPFTSLRRLPGDWGIRISRSYPSHRGYRLAWPQQSQNNPCDLCQLAKVSGAPIANGGTPFLVVPTLTARRTESVSKETMGHPGTTLRPGLDLRYSGTALTLDGTYRPDFAAVEADIDPLILNSRFKYQYPEKRAFFHEGLEIFQVRGAQQQFASRSLVDPEFGIKATGRSSWGSWGLLEVQDRAGGASLAPGETSVEGLQTRNLVGALRLDTDRKGSSFTLMGTDALMLGGNATFVGRSGGLYLDQRIGEHFKASYSRIESATRLPSGGLPASTRGVASQWDLEWSDRIWWVGANGAGTSPSLNLSNGFVGLTGFNSAWAGGGFNLRSAKAWWSGLGLGLNTGRMDEWNGNPLSRDASLYANLSTKIRLGLFASMSLRAREWSLGQQVETRFYFLNASYNRLTWLRPSVSFSSGRTIDYSTGLPALSATRKANLSGSLSAFSYGLQGGLSQLHDEATGSLLRRARRVYAKAEYAFPFSIYLRLQAQATRYDYPDASSVGSQFLQLLSGWQPNAFTHVYLGYSQARRTDLAFEPPMERLMEKGLFGKVSYAVRF